MVEHNLTLEWIMNIEGKNNVCNNVKSNTCLT